MELLLRFVESKLKAVAPAPVRTPVLDVQFPPRTSPVFAYPCKKTGITD